MSVKNSSVKLLVVGTTLKIWGAPTGTKKTKGETGVSVFVPHAKENAIIMGMQNLVIAMLVSILERVL
jgi:hypothetical protein